VPVATAVNAQFGPGSPPLGAVSVEARPAATQFRPSRDGKCAVSAGGLRDAQYRPDRPIADGLGAWPTCCSVSTLFIHGAQCRSVAYVVAKA
jgi:hypothetical protein